MAQARGEKIREIGHELREVALKVGLASAFLNVPKLAATRIQACLEGECLPKVGVGGVYSCLAH